VILAPAPLAILKPKIIERELDAMGSQSLEKQSLLPKIRSMLWPIYGKEVKKFIPMSLFLVCILFIHTLCRDLKDTLVQTRAIGASSEMLSMLKFGVVLPLSIVFMAVFMKLSNKFSGNQMFYGVTIFFISFFVLFGFVLFPNAEHLHGSLEFVTKMQSKYPKLVHFIPCITNWSISLAYTMAELWGSAVISLLFWRFANEITRSTEAPRFYSLFGFLGNLGLIASGKLVEQLAKNAEKKVGAAALTSFATSLKWQMGIILVVGIIMLLIYAWMQRNVIPDPELVIPDGGLKKKKKPKMGVWESIVYVVTNPYIMLIALLVLAYGVSNHLNEILIKKQAKILYPTDNAYNGFMGGLSFRTGCLTMILVILGTNILKSCSWRTSALITPFVIGGTFFVIFGLLVYKESIGNDALVWGASALRSVIVIGTYQMAAAKGVKYALFDSTKNMAYLPLDPETKLKSQTAVEVVGSRMGKAGGAAFVSLLTSNLLGTGHYVTDPKNMWIIGSTCLIILVLWVVAVFRINPKVVEKMKEKAAIEKETQEELDSQKVAADTSK
jgi:AAA family ATP:ADP antiporter